MYSVNALSLQNAQGLFLSSGQRRTSQPLVGDRDGVNMRFWLPNLEYFVNRLPQATISIYLNGLRLWPIEDYTPVEAGGTGTGFNAIDFAYPPSPGDYIMADYLVP